MRLDDLLLRAGRLAAATCAVLALACALSGTASGAAQQAEHLDSLAKLLAGMQPTHAGHRKIAATQVWKEHSQALQASWAAVRDGQRAAVITWRRTELPPGCPAGNTLLYPFSGPDFLNAHWLFPDCSNYVMLGLERIGDVPEVESLTEKELEQLLAGVRHFLINVFQRNYFVTGTMLKNLRTESLRGVLPVLMVAMALSGVEVVRVSTDEVVPLQQPPAVSDAGAAGAAETQRRRRLRSVTVEFRGARSRPVQRLHYFSLDATNKSLAAYPEFFVYVRSLGPTTTLLKSASYLLHGNHFTNLREAVMDATSFLLQDDTGIPYPLLVRQNWRVRLYGNYGVPIPQFKSAFQPSLAAAYEREKPAPLPFVFGYRLDKGDNHSTLIVATRPAPPGATSRDMR